MNLLELVESGDTAGVVRELGELTLEQRAARAAELTAGRDAKTSHEWVYDTPANVKAAWSIAELGCQTTPEAAAAWLMNNDRRARGCGWIVDAVNVYPAEWRAELVVKLVEQRLDRMGMDAGCLFALVEHMIRDTGCPIPTSDHFIGLWLRDRKRSDGFDDGRPPNMLGGGRGANMLARLRTDDFGPTLLPLAVVRRDVSIRRFRKEFVELAAKGKVDRDALSRRTLADKLRDTPAEKAAVKALDGDPLTDDEHEQLSRARQDLVEPLVARLLDGGTRDATEPTLTLLRALAPPPTENAALLRDHVAMLDLPTPMASYGHAVLIELDEAGMLESDVLTEACERVLLRPDKKLVRAQLSWLDRVARRDPASAGRVVVEAAAVFHHPDVALQERALDLVARHLGDAGEEVLANLQTAAEGISPGLAPRAAELFGRPPETPAEQYSEVLPAVPEPEPVPGPAETVAEVAQEAAAALANPGHVAAFERALDGLVRHARLDRSGLSEALKPVVRREPSRVGADWTQTDLYEVAVAVRGDERHDGRHTILRTDHAAERTFPEYRGVTPAGDMLRARMSEVLKVIESGTQPFLLAVPTLDTGALDAGVLVERIAEFERLRVIPAPVDLAQALLRVDPAPGEQVQRAAEELESAAGRQLARWLGDGGLPHQDSTPRDWPVTDPTSAPPGWWEPERPGPAPQPPLPPVAAALLGDRRNGIENDHKRPFLLAQLPHHRDEVAARLDLDGRRTSVPPYRADAAGPAGYAIHWHIAYGLRGTADPLLVLAAQGRLDSRLLAGQLQALLHRGVIEANRVTATLRTAAETGAYATVWSVLEAALPPLLRGKPVHGAAAFLALAVECASRCGVTGPIAEVDAVAARKGSAQTIKNARLLRDILR